MGNHHLSKMLCLARTCLKTCLGLSGELHGCSPSADSILCLGDDTWLTFRRNCLQEWGISDLIHLPDQPTPIFLPVYPVWSIIVIVCSKQLIRLDACNLRPSHKARPSEIELWAALKTLLILEALMKLQGWQIVFLDTPSTPPCVSWYSLSL